MTLKQVAKEAGVSLATASMVMSNKGRISDEVRARVTSTADRLGYRRKKRPADVTELGKMRAGILVAFDPEWDFAWRVTRSIVSSLVKELAERGATTVVVPVGLKESTEQIERDIGETGISSVFSVHYANKELFDRLESNGIPVVVINNSSFQDTFYTVCVDDFQGAYEGAQQLIRQGHRKIIYIDFNRPDMPALVSDRFVGFKKALDENHIEFQKSHRITTDLATLNDLHQKLQPLLTRERNATAIFAHDDYLAANVIAVLRDLGLRVPDDVSIIAHGDCLDYAQPLVPQISTMRINTELMGTTAAGVMAKRIAGDSESLHVLKVNQHLVVRGSCRQVQEPATP